MTTSPRVVTGLCAVAFALASSGCGTFTGYCQPSCVQTVSGATAQPVEVTAFLKNGSLKLKVSEPAANISESGANGAPTEVLWNVDLGPVDPTTVDSVAIEVKLESDNKHVYSTFVNFPAAESRASGPLLGRPHYNVLTGRAKWKYTVKLLRTGGEPDIVLDPQIIIRR